MFFFTSNCDTFGELYYLFIGIFSAFTRHDEICVYKHTSIFQGASTHSRQKARSVGKRSTHWMLRECCRCLQSGPYSQRSLYSCISAFQDAGRLVHCWFDGLLCLLPEQVVYILTLVSTEPKRCCWIGYHPLLQVRTFWRQNCNSCPINDLFPPLFYCNMKNMKHCNILYVLCH